MSSEQFTAAYGTKTQAAIFRNGSKTYYNSSLWFPPAVRKRVYALYAFVRVADDFVDRIPQDSTGFYAFVERYRTAKVRGCATGDAVVDAFVALERDCAFDPEWTEAFLFSMEWDLGHSSCADLDECLRYIYGSAEVIGLFMCRIMDLPPHTYHAAKMLGRAMQYINFIRDIREDNSLNRTYLPVVEAGLPDLSERTARANPRRFGRFVGAQLSRYREWQTEAERGYRFIPPRLRIPIQTAGSMYQWTADVIAGDPFVVYSRRVKPGKPRILAAVVASMVSAAVVGKG